MKVLTKVSSKGRRGGECGGLCGYKAHEFQRDADAFPNDSVFTAQGVEIATFHDSKAATDLNSANSVRSLWQRGDAFRKMVFHGCKCWCSRRGGGFQWKKVVTRFGFDRPKRSGHKITVIKMNVPPLSPSHCPPCNLTLATVGNYALRGSPSSQQKLIMCGRVVWFREQFEGIRFFTFPKPGIP